MLRSLSLNDNYYFEIFQNTGIKSFSCLCRQQCVVGQKMSTNGQMSALPDCFPSISCLLLREYWNLINLTLTLFIYIALKSNNCPKRCLIANIKNK